MTDHAELPPRSFFNADDLSLLIAEHPDAPQFLAVKIADAHDAALAALVAERDAWLAALSDPVAVHLNMLRGGIAKPSITNIIHLYGAEPLRAALAQGGET